MKRTHTCGELTKKDVGKEVVLQGWVHKRRDHGGIIFIDLRDRYGVTQIVFDPQHDKESHNDADKVRREFVIEIEGKVRPRPADMINTKMATGEIEVICDSIKILCKAETPPIEVNDMKIASEDLRLKYRYLHLRRPQMQKHLLVRHKAAQAARKFLSEQGFLEITTPMFVKSTPEGARDYIVPSRVNPGMFYALPQSPQLYKQILMASGFDRYFQMPICLRDEDLRADRQPEHMQIDLEMSFVELEDLFEIIEGIMKTIFKDAIGANIKTPFPRISYTDAMEKYGTDKPDLRFGMELMDITSIMKEGEFEVFNKIIKEGGQVKCICAEGYAELSRKKLEGDYSDFVLRHGAKALTWFKMKDGKLESPIAKFYSSELLSKIVMKTGCKENDLLFVIGDKPKHVANALGHLRIKVAEEKELLKKDEFKFCFTTDFPLFEWDDELDKWTPMHHMFCKPKEEWVDKLEEDPGNVICTQYDVILNGIELASGSLRINDPELQERVMKIIGMTKEEAQQKFGFLLEAFKYGAPPHGGVGLGFDRIVALILGFNDIREIIAFPKNKSAQCPMDGSPSPIDDTTMKECHIKLDLKGKAKEARDELELAAEDPEGPTEDLVDEEKGFTSD
jgi:aspartyl-tRNA synthetase